jgi:hypothetical protein
LRWDRRYLQAPRFPLIRPVPAQKLTPASISTPTMAPTVLSEIDLIKNGSFESGSNDWYIAADSGIAVMKTNDAPDGSSVLAVPTGAYGDQAVILVPETKYVLAGRGRVEKKGDYGQIGVAFFDKDGHRQKDQEPKPITFKSVAYKNRHTTFTVPAGVATMKVYVFKENGTDNERGSLFLDAISLHSVAEAFEESGLALEAPQLNMPLGYVVANEAKNRRTAPDPGPTYSFALIGLFSGQEQVNGRYRASSSQQLEYSWR